MRASVCAMALAGTAIFVLAGCGKHYWNRTGASQADFTRDSNECARENALYHSGTKDYGIVLVERYRACLKSKGWARAQHPEPPPGWFRGIEGDDTVKFEAPPPAPR